MEALIAALLKYGPIPALLVLAALVGYLIREVEKNGKKDAERAEALSATISTLQENMEKRFAEHADRMACIERDYLTRETHYKDIGGWRTDLNQLRSDTSAEINAVRGDISALRSDLINTVLKGAKNAG